MARTVPGPGGPALRRTTIDAAIASAENARADESLLRRGGPAGRVAVLSDRAVSVGIGVPAIVPYLARARADGWAIVRRSSGGTAVAHGPGDLTWTIVLPRSDVRVGNDYARKYDRLGRAVVRFLSSQGVTARWAPPPAVSDGYCLLGHRGSALWVEGRVLGGAAQHVSGRALLHHGVLPRSIDRKALGRLFDLPERGALDRLTSLAEAGIGERSEVLAASLAATLDEELAGT